MHWVEKKSEMRDFATASCFALVFAIPACVAAVAYPFDRGAGAASSVDGSMTYQLFCLYALGAGAVAGIIYAGTLAYRSRHSSIVKSAAAGMFTLLCAIVVPLMVALIVGAEAHWLGRSVLAATLIVCPIACAFVLGRPRVDPAINTRAP